MLFSECKKTNTTNNYISNNHLESITIGQLRTTQIIRGTITQLRLDVLYNTGQHQKVSLAINGLPTGITGKFEGASTGYPAFSTTFNFYDTAANSTAIPGTYEAQLLVTGESGYSRQLPFNIVIPPLTDSNCAAQYAGIYNACKVSTAAFADTAEIDPTNKNKLWFRNMANSGKRVGAFFSCSNSEFLIPQQIFGVDTLSGSGNLILTGYGGYTFALNVITNGVTKTAYYNLR
jgi:hypothetical protein